MESRSRDRDRARRALRVLVLGVAGVTTSIGGARAQSDEESEEAPAETPERPTRKSRRARAAAAEPAPAPAFVPEATETEEASQEAAAVAHAAPRTRGVTVGAGIRAAFAIGREGQGIDHLIVEPRIRARLNETFSFETTLSFGRDYRVDYPAPPAQTVVELVPVETNNVLDAIIKIEPSKYFNIWFGRFIPPSDRDNLSTPFFQTAWNYPRTISRYPSGFAGSQNEAAAFGWGRYMQGRDEGAAVWGHWSRLKYQLGVFNLHVKPQKEAGTRLAGRLTLNLLDLEPGYYNQSTYLGTKDILAIGVAAQYQKEGFFEYRVPVMDAPGDFANWHVERKYCPSNVMGEFRCDPIELLTWNVDVLFEKRLGSAGTLTLQGAYFRAREPLPNYLGNSSIPTGAPVPKDADSVLGLFAYLFNGKIGPGRLQPVFRWQHQLYDITRTNMGFLAVKQVWTMDAFINYIIEDHNIRLSLGYQHTRINADERPQFINIGAQMQF